MLIIIIYGHLTVVATVANYAAISDFSRHTAHSLLNRAFARHFGTSPTRQRRHLATLVRAAYVAIIESVRMLAYFRNLNLGLARSLHGDTKWRGVHSNSRAVVKGWDSSDQFIEK